MTPEGRAVIDASLKRFMLDGGRNTSQWRKAVSRLIKARADEDRKRRRLLRAIAGAGMVA